MNQQQRPGKDGREQERGAYPPGGDHRSLAQGEVPLEENQRHPSDPLKPGENEEQGTRLEKLVSKIVPAGHEISDEDILDPGHMTPGAPPVDNRS